MCVLWLDERHLETRNRTSKPAVSISLNQSLCLMLLMERGEQRNDRNTETPKQKSIRGTRSFRFVVRRFSVAAREGGSLGRGRLLYAGQGTEVEERRWVFFAPSLATSRTSVPQRLSPSLPANVSDTETRLSPRPSLPFPLAHDEVTKQLPARVFVFSFASSVNPLPRYAESERERAPTSGRRFCDRRHQPDLLLNARCELS